MDIKTEFLKQVGDLFSNGSYGEAEILCREALDRNSTSCFSKVCDKEQLAQFYNVYGNILLAQQKKREAVKNYELSIRHNPYYAIAHYNKRIAHFKTDNEESVLNRAINNLNITPSLTTTANFVINTIAHVPEHRFNTDSSDEESDNEFNILLDSCTDSSFPFTTMKPEKCVCLKGNRSIKRNIIDDRVAPLTLQVNDKMGEGQTVVANFLKKLIDNGFSRGGRVEDLKTVSVSIGLNRMKSVSSRKNQSLSWELETNLNTDVTYKKFAFFWKCNWYNNVKGKSYGKIVKYRHVRSFYKKLKRKDLKKAKQFIEQEELNLSVPYRELREYVKNHIATKKLVREYRIQNPNANVYLSLIDSDTIDFNGIYTAYRRIIKGCYKLPTCMTTGYEYPEDWKHGRAYKMASQLDRMIRVLTTFYIPLGTYYPEPNMCILIPKEMGFTISESFINARDKMLGLESPALLKAILNNKNERYDPNFIFSEDNPIITTIPTRVKLTRLKKNIREFTSEFTYGPASPNLKDINAFKVSQSHFNSKNRDNSLFINGAISYSTKAGVNKIGVFKKLTGYVSEIRKKSRSIQEVTKDMLQYNINENDIDKLVQMNQAVDEYTKEFCDSQIRSQYEDDLIQLIINNDIEINTISREMLLVLAQESVLELLHIKNRLIEVLLDTDIELVKYICYDEGIIELLKEKDREFIDAFFDCLENDFDDFERVYDLNEYDITTIIERYKDNPLHLQCMADALEFLYQNSDDEDKVRFAIDNDYVDNEDIGTVKEQLCEGREHQDDFPAAYMDFDAVLNRIIEVDSETDERDSEEYEYEYEHEYY